MTREPDVRELLGDLAPDERARLERVHNLLLAAGPPPELPQGLASPPAREARVSVLPQRRRGAALLLAAALAAATFGVGYLVGGRNEKSGFDAAQVIRLHGTGRAPAALATIRVGHRDRAGNLPMLVTVRGLPKLPPTGYYALALTKHGRPVVTCGTFRVPGRGGPTTVRFPVAYRISEFDGWVVTEYKHGRKVEPVVLTS